MKDRVWLRIGVAAAAMAACVAVWLFLAKTGYADVPDADWPVSRRPAEADLAAKVEKLSALVVEIEKRGLDAAYARSTLVLAEDFIGYAREDEAGGRPGRAAYVRGYLDEALDAAIGDAQALIADPSRNRPIPRPPLRDIAIRDGAFFAGGVEVMFGGVGHFGKVREDIPKFGDYGFNLIQIEIGPNSVITGPGPDNVRTDAITNDIIKTFDNAEKHNVMINLLLSPHYFPQWALDMYPELKECGVGFIQYCVSDPRARKVLRRFLEVLIPMVKDKPALQSYTLANEPIFDERSAAATSRFRDYLKEKYGSIGNLNRAWHKNFKDFDRIKIDKDVFALGAAARYDWMKFHNELGTDFFRWMKGVIRAMDPRTPVHIKFMDSMFAADEALLGIDREALEQVTDISGNDSTIRYPGFDGYALHYRQNAAFYDFLKSMRPDLPIQNSETHIIADDVTRFYPENYISASLWIQYLHGMGASTIWVWERGDGVSLGNNILSRPNCAAAAARTTLDVRRLAPETTALANAQPPIHIYYSQASRAMQFDFLEKWNPAYELALYQGRPVRMVTDSMVEAGLDPAKVPVLIIPEYIFTTNEIYAKLTDYVRRGGRAVAFGRPFVMNQYDKRRKTDDWNGLACGNTGNTAAPGAGCVAPLPTFDRENADRDFRAMHELLYGILSVPQPELLVADAEGRPVLGVEYRSAAYGGGRLAYVFNTLDREITVNLKTGAGPIAHARDLINGREVAPSIILAPMELAIFKF